MRLKQFVFMAMALMLSKLPELSARYCLKIKMSTTVNNDLKGGFKFKTSTLLGAAFLMATSAIGPGFLTQTSLFTQELLTSFGFVILVSILLDIGIQLNIWRIVTASGKRAQDLANSVIPGMGFFLAFLIAFGGLVFNIGNIAGCGLGMNVLFSVKPEYGAIVSCIIALAIFWLKDAIKKIDILVKWLGLLMILLTVYVAFSSHPPVAEALHRTFWPEKIDVLKIVTIIGGSVGGYISFAGAHRLLEGGISGPDVVSKVSKSAIGGILVTSLMRYILFLAALGVVWGGVQLSSGNPAATVFQSAAGELGYKVFGIVIWSAAITSVIGASFTSVSFLKTLFPFIKRNEKAVISLFIIISTIVFLSRANPVQLLVLAGALNGIILPFSLIIILISALQPSLVRGYKHPVSLHIIGWAAAAILTWLSIISIRNIL